MAKQDDRGLSSCLKATLVVAGVGALLAGAVGLAAYTWWHRNGESFVKGTQDEQEQGRRFGSGSTEQGCLDEAKARLRVTSGFSGAIRAQLFLSTCLQSAGETPDFCKDVPHLGEILRTGAWVVERCKGEDLNQQTCRQLYSAMQANCEARRMSSAPPSAATPPAPR